ncbi:MAG TPA: zinc-dependent alcohol dehydrogenase family protein [Chloroflexia bacterium]|nr:zinc-dependent alcohol dehydrogenase family protein [Chloroflexia bacterium]
MFITGFGGPEVFEEREVAKPVPGPTEVLVKVYASSINPVDYKIRQAGSWAGVKPPAIIGYDVAGIIEAIGPGVKDFKVGDEVYYTPQISGAAGSYAEYHVADESIVAIKPSNISFEEAASIPLAGGTAWDALITRMRLEVGETALIHAGAGGVGSLAVQIAKAAGAKVFATANGKNAELVKSLGADRVIDYKTENFEEVVRTETGGRGVDLAFDTVGGDTLSRSLNVIRPFGRAASVVNATDLNAAYFKNITVHFVFLQRERYKLDHLRVLIERGQLKPVVDSVLPLNQVAEAHRKVEQGGVRGKVVLHVAG